MGEQQPHDECADCNDILNPDENAVYKELIFVCRQCNYRHANIAHCIYVRKTKHTLQEVINMSDDISTYLFCVKCGDSEAAFFRIITRFVEEKIPIYYVCGNPQCTKRWPKNRPQ